MLKCNHVNIVRIYHMEEDLSQYYLCTELCQESVEIAVQLGKYGLMDARIQLCRAMAEGVQAFHDAGFVHGNLSPSNFLVEDGVPRLCGFSSSVPFNEAAIAIKLNTIAGTRGYMPAEVIAGRKLHVIVEVANPLAVDTFALGATLCFVLSAGTQPFRANATGGTAIERNIMTGSHGIDDIDSLSAEAKHLVSRMLSVSPIARSSYSTQYVLQHPLFWSVQEKVNYLGESVGNVLDVRKHKSKMPFVMDLEALVDTELGPYNEGKPDEGGSWSRQLNPKYPLTGEWVRHGTAQF